MLHCRMLDNTAQAQQEALGVLGVNLIHGALTKGSRYQDIISGLLEELPRSRMQVSQWCSAWCHSVAGTNM